LSGRVNKRLLVDCDVVRSCSGAVGGSEAVKGGQ